MTHHLATVIQGRGIDLQTLTNQIAAVAEGVGNTEQCVALCREGPVLIQSISRDRGITRTDQFACCYQECRFECSGCCHWISSRFVSCPLNSQRVFTLSQQLTVPVAEC